MIADKSSNYELYIVVHIWDVKNNFSNRYSNNIEDIEIKYLYIKDWVDNTLLIRFSYSKRLREAFDY